MWSPHVCLHGTMTIALSYTSSFIKSIGNLAKSKSLFPCFHLDQLTWSRIITLGIISKPRKYRWSREEKEHFHKIYTIVSEIQKTIPFNKALSRTIDQCMIHSLTKHAAKYHQMKQGHIYNGMLINCRLLTHKTEYI